MAVATKVRQYGHALREPLEEFGRIGPLPRYLINEMSDTELANEIREMYEMRRMQMAPRIIMDQRLLRYMDPEKLQDQWQNVWTGEPLRKLSKSKGRAIEIFNWSSPVIEALVGLMSGHQPFAYAIDVRPENPQSNADAVQSQAIEDWLYLQHDRLRYPLTYMDGLGWTMGLGRSWKMVTTDFKTREQRCEIVWPGHVAAFWQNDQRTLEQAIVARELTAGEAISVYASGDTPEEVKLRGEIIDAVRPPARSSGASSSRPTGGVVDNQTRDARCTALTLFNRIGPGWMGEGTGLATVLLYAREREYGVLMLDRVKDTGYEDLPLYCTPRFKIMDKPPDEATGALMKVAPLNTEFNEVFSAARDMVNRAIYPRFKAKGFSFRNAPRFIRGSAMYALPRDGQDIARIDEVLNTVPVEQILTRLEDMIMVFPGLNRYFLGSAPPSETSGDAIDAALNASISRLATTLNEVKECELWFHRQLLSQAEKWGEYVYEGKTVKLSQLIEGKRDVMLYWADQIEIGKIKRQQMALAARNAGIISTDTTQDLFGVRSKVDEMRKVRKEFADPVLRPEKVSQTAAAIIQGVNAQREQKIAAQLEAGQPIPTPPQYRISLAGALSPEEVASAAEHVGIKGAPPVPNPGGSAAMPGRQPVAIPPTPGGASAPARAAEVGRTAAAQNAPPSFPGNNAPGGATGPLPQNQSGDVAPTGAPVQGGR